MFAPPRLRHKEGFLTIVGLLAGGLLVHVPAAAQEPTDSVRTELARLAEMVDSLAAEVARLKAEGRTGEAADAGDALARLRAAADSAAGRGPPAAEPEPEDFVGRQRSLQALNPEISVTGDVLVQAARWNTDDAAFLPREFELSFVSNLDPFSRARIFASHHSPGGELIPFPDDGEEHEEGGMAVEEGYLEWVGLPAGLGVKLGKFYQQFGQLNRWHGHALPFQSRSLPHLAFIGEEPLAQTGVSLHWLVPLGGRGGTYELTFEATSSDNHLLFGASRGVALLGNLNAFWNLSASTDLNLGLSWVGGEFENEVSAGDRNLYGAEFAFTWRPPSRARYRGFTLRGGVMSLTGLEPAATPPPDELLPLEDGHALGTWAMAEARLSTNWLVGARFDRTEDPRAPDRTSWLVSPTVTWWQSEFVRLRAEYDLLDRSFLTTREGRLLIQVTFAMGPHKHENY